MSIFAALAVRTDDDWSLTEADLDGCESLDDLADVLRDLQGDVRLLLIEQDDEYAAIVRLDEGEDEARAFLSDGHAADNYPMAAVVAEELAEVGGDELDGDDDAPPAHDSAPFGEPAIVADLGTPADDLVELAEHEGTLPVDLLVAVCGKAGFGEAFEELRG
ncbi:tRNA adenosine deaminase-associated protein [Jatrophihabitans fulvus]